MVAFQYNFDKLLKFIGFFENQGANMLKILDHAFAVLMLLTPCYSMAKQMNKTDIHIIEFKNLPTIGNFQNTENSFLSNRISAVLASEYNNNFIAAGIDAEGFSIYNRITKLAQNYGPNATNKNDERFVNHFYEDEKGNVYAAGGTGGEEKGRAPQSHCRPPRRRTRAQPPRSPDGRRWRDRRAE